MAHIPSGTSSTPLRTQGILWTHTIRSLSMVRMAGEGRQTQGDFFLFALFDSWGLKDLVSLSLACLVPKGNP